MASRNRVKAEIKINEQMGKQSEYNAVPAYRAYGVKKREIRIWEIFKLSLFRFIAIVFLYFLFSIVFLGLFAFLFFGNILVTFVFSVIVSVAFAHVLSKPIRKRLKFQRKLKRLCKSKGYKLKVEQGFWNSLFWSPNEIDFSLNTGRHTYFVHYLTVRKYRSSVLFESKDSFVRTKYPMPNIFTVIFGFKPKSKKYSLSFPTPYTIGTHKNINAIVVNPVCRELFYKNRDGVTEPTGSGVECFGYTVYTGSGFLESIVRNEENADFSSDILH